MYEKFTQKLRNCSGPAASKTDWAFEHFFGVGMFTPPSANKEYVWDQMDPEGPKKMKHYYGNCYGEKYEKPECEPNNDAHWTRRVTCREPKRPCSDECDLHALLFFFHQRILELESKPSMRMLNTFGMKHIKVNYR